MVFCGTLGFFIGGASAAKGSLDRFGAKRSALGAFVAALIVIGIVGGANLGTIGGVALFGLSCGRRRDRGDRSAAIGRPQDKPALVGVAVSQRQRPRPHDTESGCSLKRRYLEADPMLVPRRGLRLRAGDAAGRVSRSSGTAR